MEKIKPINRDDWVDADPVNNIPGAIPPAKAFSQTMEEMVNVIIASGQEPSGEDLHQFEKGIKQLVQQKVDEANLLAVSNTVYQRNIGDFFFTLNKMRGTKETGSLNGAFECNGDEFSEGDFTGDANPYKLLVNNNLPWVSYDNYVRILARFGNCGYFGLDKENRKFKVPTITDAFLQSGTPGAFKEAGLPDHIHGVKVSGDGSKSGHDTRTGYLARGFTKYSSPWSGNNNNGQNKVLLANAGESNPIYGASSTVQPAAVTARIMVQLANEIDNATSIESYVTTLKTLQADSVEAIKTASDAASAAGVGVLTEIETAKTEALQNIATAEDSAVAAVTEIKTATVTEVESVKTAAIERIDGYADEIEQVVDKALDTMEMLDELNDTAAETLTNLNAANTKAKELIPQLTELNDTAEATVQAVTAQATAAKNAADAAKASETAAATAVNGFDDAVAVKITEAESAVDTAKDNAVTAVNACVDDIKTAVENAETAAEQATNTANTAKRTADAVVEQLEAFDATVSTAKTEITELASEEKTGIQSAADEAQTSAVSAVDEAKTAAVSEVEAAGAVIAGYQQPITVLAETSGEIALEVNKIYTLSIAAATSFTLPTPANTNVFNQIKVMLTVAGTPAITWGTSNFFNKATPEIEAGSYDVYFDYDNTLAAWVCGAMPKGAAE